MKTNTFYKPKNEFGDLLASEKYVNKSIQQLSDKHDLDLENLSNRHKVNLENLEKKHDADINGIASNIISLDERPPFKIEFINDGASIELFISNAWAACTSLDERIKLKTDIGRSLYLRKTGEGDTAQYEEYICTNPGNIRVEDDTFSEGVYFNRLGAVEAIVATTKRYGSVTLEHSIYNNTIEEWNKYTSTARIAGEETDIHLPTDGLAVAPCALYDFFVADENLRKNLAEEIATRISEDVVIKERLERVETNISTSSDRLDAAESNIKHIKEELLGVIENESEGIQNTRLDVNEAAIKDIKDLIGINGCCSICGEKECSCECDGSALDCTIICKLHTLESGLTDNSDQIANVDDKLEDELRPAIQNNAESIDVINKTIGNKRDANRNNSIYGAINELFSVTSSNSNKIDTNTTKITEVETQLSDDLAILRKETLTDNIGVRPDDGYATTLWAQAKRINTSLSHITSNITAVDNKIGIRPTDGTVANDVWSQLIKSQEAIEDNAEHIIKNKSDVDKIIGEQPAGATNIWSYITAAEDDIKKDIKSLDEAVKTNNLAITKNANDIVTIGNNIESINANIGDKGDWPKADGSIHARINKINEVIGQYDETKKTIAERLDSSEDNISSLNEQISEIELTANNAKETAERIYKAHHVFNSLIIECDLPAEDEGKDGVEAQVALHYCDICDIIERNTGDKILPSNLSVIFNGARFTVEDDEMEAEHFYPEVSYLGKNDADKNSHRALVLKFAGSTVERHILVSLTYYDNDKAQPSKINVIKIN